MTSVTTKPIAGRRVRPETGEPGRDLPSAPGDDPGNLAAGAGRAGREGSRTRFLRPSGRLLWVLSAALLVAAVAVAGTLGRSALATGHQQANLEQARVAGQQLAVNFVTMNHSTFDADSRRVLDGATGSFKQEYASTLAKLKPVIVENETVSTVERSEAAVVSATDSGATVLVGVVAPTTNAATPKTEKKTYRLRLGLTKVGPEWKVSSLDFVS